MTAEEEQPALPSIGVVILTQGTRPTELGRCLDGLRAQRGVALDILVVGNGWSPGNLGPDVRTHALAENAGIPEGRNVGAALVEGELIFFFDDDAWIDDPQLLAKVARIFADRPRVGSVQPRLCDADGTTMRRWVPRLRTRDPQRPGPGFTIVEGITIVRRAAFEQVGGFPGQFFYGHEGVELTWRLWDAGWEVHYAGDLAAHHPATTPARHAGYLRNNARNRVWVARRNLPALLIPVYLGVWTLIMAARLLRRPKAFAAWLGGFAEGVRTPAGPRRPMRWATVVRLARLGHPPIV